LIHSIITANPTVHLHFISLQPEVIVSNFEYSLPTFAAFENKEIPPLELTAPSPAWIPYEKDLLLKKRATSISWDNWSLLREVMAYTV
jgi:hypothetical protein